MTDKELLILAGRMAEAARDVVGGQRLTIGFAAPANVDNLASKCEALRQAVDAYDAAIMVKHYEG